MKNRRVAAIGVVFLLAVLTAPDQIPAQGLPSVRVISIEGYRKRFDNPSEDAIQRYFLIDGTTGDRNGDGILDYEPLQARAILALFPGGDGRLFLNPETRELGSAGFPFNHRYHLAVEGFIVAAVDAASDFVAHNHPTRVDLGFPHQQGLRGHHLPDRLYGAQYRQDLEALFKDLRQKYPGLPVWAVGHSFGTVSAAVAATELADPPDGIILLGPSIRPPGGLGHLHDIDLSLVKVPVFIVSHQDDLCLRPLTEPETSEDLARRFTSSPRVHFLVLSGGSNLFGNDCEGLGAHYFFGLEDELVKTITAWIKEPVQ